MGHVYGDPILCFDVKVENKEELHILFSAIAEVILYIENRGQRCTEKEKIDAKVAVIERRIEHLSGNFASHAQVYTGVSFRRIEEHKVQVCAVHFGREWPRPEFLKEMLDTYNLKSMQAEPRKEL